MGRKKNFAKYLQFYKQNFGLKGPYEVLVDADFIVACQKMSIPIQRLLGKLVQESIIMKITPCVLSDKRLAEIDKWDVNRNLRRISCPHKNRVSSLKCISHYLKSDAQYCVASLNELTRKAITKIPGVPIFYLLNDILMLQPPSNESCTLANQVTPLL
eukprot:TRINITY_DN2319_c0_g2_i8.p1 TRINITY_DN2319_c0_g2~~TRINITY_DN2319_c0_g2_i8.p1  ORF type:complete len:158 (+),score=14.31 TRINITY_DN2319_c0_g2_i8:75-548(+)